MKRTSLITLILGTALAVAPAVHAAPMSEGGGNGSGSPASSSRPYGMNEATYQAVLSRGSDGAAVVTRDEALNKLYGNAVTALTPQQFKSLYEAGLGNLSPEEQAAIVARGAALNKAYGAGGSGNVAATNPSSTAGDDNSIVWNATYGAAALTGAMLLVLGFAVVSRRRHHQPGF
jgi:hypothetical protein